MSRATVGIYAPGVSLILGGFLYFLFFLGPVLDRDLSLAPSHGFQLGFFAVMIVTLGIGLWSGVRNDFLGRRRVLVTLAVTLATLGMVAVIGAFALGIGGLGLLALIELKRRVVGSALLIGCICWLSLWSTGARFDSEDSLPLTNLGIALGFVGLLLISGGLVAWGWVLTRSRVNERSAIPGGGTGSTSEVGFR